jgi:hypothetical protein
MKLLSRALVGLLLLVPFAGATSCKKGTYLELVFKGAGLPPVNYIGVSLTLASTRVANGNVPDPLPAMNVVKFPASAAFQLDDESGALGIAATAYDATNTALAQANTSTTIKHGETWTVDIDFGGAADAGTDASPDLGVASDAGTDPLVTITDGSVASGCGAATVQAAESVSLDYNSSGQDMDAGNMLWAYLGPAEQYIGWMSFGLQFIPKGAHLTKATLNLFMVQATGGVPTLAIDYSPTTGWTRKSKASDVSNGGAISTGGPYLTPNAAPASTPYTLDVTSHDWATDIGNGTVTLGVENTSVAAAAVTSKVEFHGVDNATSPDLTRPTLDVEFCR